MAVKLPMLGPADKRSATKAFQAALDEDGDGILDALIEIDEFRVLERVSDALTGVANLARSLADVRRLSEARGKKWL